MSLVSPTVSGNQVSETAAIKLRELDSFRLSGFVFDPNSDFYHFVVTGGTFSTNSVDIENNQDSGYGPKTSSIDFGGTQTDWATILLKATSF